MAFSSLLSFYLLLLLEKVALVSAFCNTRPSLKSTAISLPRKSCQFSVTSTCLFSSSSPVPSNGGHNDYEHHGGGADDVTSEFYKKIKDEGIHLGVEDLLDAEVDEEENGDVVTMMSAKPFDSISCLSHTAPNDTSTEQQQHNKNEKHSQQKIKEWESALSFFVTNNNNIDRCYDAPDWATRKAGFVNGTFLTDALFARFPEKGDVVPNEYYLTLEGLTELDRLLHSGCYRIKAPEQSALLTITWLLGNNQIPQAISVLQEIIPYFHQLRFYPDKADTPLIAATTSATSSVFVRSVKSVMEDVEYLLKQHNDLEDTRNRRKIALQRALNDWLPLKQKLLTLWMETTCKEEEDNGTTTPLEEDVSQDWLDRATLLVEEFNRLAARDQETNRQRTRKGSTKTMVSCIKTCLVHGSKQHLSDKQKCNLQTVLSGSIKKYGTPGSTRFTEYFQQLQKLAPPDETPPMIELLDRLSKEDPELGLSQEVIEKIITTTVNDLPEKLQSSVRRTRMGSLEELVEVGLVSSSEILADMIPKIKAQSANSHIPDSSLRRLAFAIDLAINDRQVSVFSLEPPVRFEDLPWTRPVLLQYQQRPGETEIIIATLKFVVETALTTFPQTILPNKLVWLMRGLVRATGIDIPLAWEHAADNQSLHLACKLLKGSVYERYFGLNYKLIRKQDSPISLLGKEHPGGGSIVGWIEMQQIITAHNLAACYVCLGLELNWSQLALEVWDWILSQIRVSKWLLFDGKKKDKVQRKIGYAWRHLLFFVSVANDTNNELVPMMRERLKTSKIGVKKSRLVEKVFLSQLEKALKGAKPDIVLIGSPPEEHSLLSIELVLSWMRMID